MAANTKYDERDDTDIGNARRLVDRFPTEIRYAYEPGRWYVWDGRTWRADRSGRVTELAKDVARRIFAEAAEAAGSRRSELARHAVRSSSLRSIRSMVALAASDPRVARPASRFDADPFLINTPAGIADAETGAILPHDRERLMTRITQASGDLSATCPTADAVLARAFHGRADLIDFFWRAIGYSMLGTTREQVMFVCHGRGANGKSTVIDAIVHALGDYAVTTPAATFVAKDRERGGPEPELVDLHGARFVAISEWSESTRLNEGRVKSMTGGDRITARGLHKDPFTFDVTATLWLPCNHKPKVSDDDAIHRRLRFIPFAVQVPEAERDPRVKQAVRLEIDGIFARAFAGAQRYLRDGLGQPREVAETGADFRRATDPFARWLDECCDLGTGLDERAGMLRRSYRDWCAANELAPLSAEDLSARLRASGARAVRRADGVHWLSVALRTGGAPFERAA